MLSDSSSGGPKVDRRADRAAPAQKALMLQRPLPNSVLRMVARGVKEDGLPN
jgi:hypothetical protein